MHSAVWWSEHIQKLSNIGGTVCRWACGDRESSVSSTKWYGTKEENAFPPQSQTLFQTEPTQSAWTGLYMPILSNIVKPLTVVLLEQKCSLHQQYVISTDLCIFHELWITKGLLDSFCCLLFSVGKCKTVIIHGKMYRQCKNYIIIRKY